MFEVFNVFVDMFSGNDAKIADVLKGFALCVSSYADKCKILKPVIEDMATRIKTTAKFGAAKYLSIDTLEAFAKLSL